MGEKFLEEHGDVVNQVKADPGSTDLRTFIREELFGCLFSALFNQKAVPLPNYYYGEMMRPIILPTLMTMPEIFWSVPVSLQ